MFTFEISDYVCSLHHCYLGIDLSDGVWSHQLSRDQTRQFERMGMSSRMLKNQEGPKDMKYADEERDQ